VLITQKGPKEKNGHTVVVEGNVDFDCLRNKILNVLELVELVLAHYILSVGNYHTCHETTKRGDTVSLTNTQYRRVDVGRSSLQSTIGICDRTSSIVVEMCFLLRLEG